jgi:hypothetical protein
MKIRKQLAVLGAGAIAAVALAAGPAAAAGNGVTAKECFGAPYGKTGLQYRQFKQDPAHPLAGGYGLPGVLAAHGPDGAIPLCAG